MGNNLYLVLFFCFVALSSHSALADEILLTDADFVWESYINEPLGVEKLTGEPDLIVLKCADFSWQSSFGPLNDYQTYNGEENKGENEESKEVYVESQKEPSIVSIINHFDEMPPQNIYDWICGYTEYLMEESRNLAYPWVDTEQGVFVHCTVYTQIDDYQNVDTVIGKITTTTGIQTEPGEVEFINEGEGLYSYEFIITCSTSDSEKKMDNGLYLVSLLTSLVTKTDAAPLIVQYDEKIFPPVELNSFIVKRNNGIVQTYEKHCRLPTFKDDILFDPHKVTLVAQACPSHLLIVDKDGNKVGLERQGDDFIEYHEIPSAIYSRGSDPEYILLMDVEEYTVKVQSYDEGQFNLTLSEFADGNWKEINYLQVPLESSTTASIEVPEINPNYAMKIDFENDGAIDETRKPDSIGYEDAPKMPTTEVSKSSTSSDTSREENDADNADEELVNTISKAVQSVIENITKGINPQIAEDLKNIDVTSNFYSIGLILILVIGVIMLYRKS